MLQINNKSTSDFSICFGGENEIEIKTLLSTLESTLELINYVINKDQEDAFIKINVKGTQRGSFEIELQALAGIVPTLITSQSINLAKTCIDSVVGLLNIKKHLKGEPPKSVDSGGEVVKIENCTCDKIEVNVNTYNLYSEDSDRMISKIFSNCDRESFAIKQDNEKKILIEKPEFENMIKEVSLDSITQERVVKNITQVELYIKKPDLTGNSQWELIYPLRNKSIKAVVDDRNFVNKIHSGDISINAKTTIIVELEIETYLDEFNEKIKEVFNIKKVIQVKQSGTEQMRF
ncbi:hypothetical protein ACSVC9_11755 [Clostridium sp. LBM24168]